VFVGIGWLRAFAEKATDPGWRDGTSLSTFLHDRVRAGDIALPPYEAIVTGLFIPSAASLGWIVMIGQMLAGLAILTGTLTRMALLGGLFMNLNFLLAGRTDPNAFYIVIQTLLLLVNAGTVLGLDAHLVARDHARFRLARPASSWADWVRPGAALAISLGVASYALVNVTDWGPAGSVHDPAMILAVLAMMTSGWSAIACLRVGGADAPASESHEPSRPTTRRIATPAILNERSDSWHAQAM
jgi:thiosulfate dehydrogenase [quinone] large subunit